MKINVSFSTKQYSVLIGALSFSASQYGSLEDFFADKDFSERSRELRDLISYILENREVN